MDRVNKDIESLFGPFPPRASHVFHPNHPMMDKSNGHTFSNNSRSGNYAPVGSICKALHLYQMNPDDNGITSWTKDSVAETAEPVKDPESSQYAIIVREVKCCSGYKRLEIDSIVVQSAHLKRVLAGVMYGYRGITMSLEKVEFRKPFGPFIHRWELFTGARDNEPNAEAKAHLNLLYEVMAIELNDVIKRKNSLVPNGIITFDMLWTIFEPGDTAYSIVNGHKRAFQHEKSFIGPDFKDYEIQAVYIDYNGYGFGYRKYKFSIPAFEGTKPIMELPVIPFMCHDDRDTLLETLTLRGKLWYMHKGYHYKQYGGLALATYMGREISYNITSRVIIDTEAYLAFHSDNCLKDLEDMSSSLGDAQLLFATPILRGYSLEDRKWLELFIDGVSDINWNPRPFKSLVLPDGEEENVKKLVLALANSQSKKVDANSDVLQGRCRSVIMLLQGPPGVGKTLTAECVAEVMKVPLYVLSARALGNTTARVEESLKSTLPLIAKWGALLFLEDADIFIQEPNPSDLRANELSYVYLALLEHYQGILFLASDCVKTIASAFENRIDATIRYPDLNTDTRRHIWKQLLGKTDKKAFSKSDLNYLEDRELNGRQIKKVLKTARTLARYQGDKLNFEHVQNVLNLADDWFIY